MLQIQQYVKPESLEEAYTLLTGNRNNQIIGGMMWLKMQDRRIPVGIDLSDLDLNGIEETQDSFIIKAMTPLRMIELHPALHTCYDGMFRSACKDIVGVQFRNMATLGGSLYSRFGFSDILTLLLSLDCEVHLYHGGTISIKDYAAMPYERDILTHIVLKKEAMKGVFQCVRKSATDISAFHMAIVQTKENYRISIGARPKRAVLYELPLSMTKEEIKAALKQVELGDNMRAGKAYRERLCEAFIEKAFQSGGALCK